ncbi:hypothetical protein F0562_015311 [Nyssa sinensis]|uniref:Uncharacterized protein n=1 Tax=Nyssa sinensis TaxID=561372 RepID=A0A5J4ZJ30_9ASTE|nr:hypothetical protein F0562_015311 [Nyssa sinensis]
MYDSDNHFPEELINGGSNTSGAEKGECHTRSKPASSKKSNPFDQAQQSRFPAAPKVSIQPTAPSKTIQPITQRAAPIGGGALSHTHPASSIGPRGIGPLVTLPQITPTKVGQEGQQAKATVQPASPFAQPNTQKDRFNTVSIPVSQQSGVTARAHTPAPLVRVLIQQLKQGHCSGSVVRSSQPQLSGSSTSMVTVHHTVHSFYSNNIQPLMLTATNVACQPAPLVDRAFLYALDVEASGPEFSVNEKDLNGLQQGPDPTIAKAQPFVSSSNVEATIRSFQDVGQTMNVSNCSFQRADASKNLVHLNGSDISVQPITEVHPSYMSLGKVHGPSVAASASQHDLSVLPTTEAHSLLSLEAGASAAELHLPSLLAGQELDQFEVLPHNSIEIVFPSNSPFLDDPKMMQRLSPADPNLIP